MQAKRKKTGRYLDGEENGKELKKCKRKTGRSNMEENGKFKYGRKWEEV